MPLAAARLSSWTAASDAARTSSRHWPWAPEQYLSHDHICMDWRLRDKRESSRFLKCCAPRSIAQWVSPAPDQSMTSTAALCEEMPCPRRIRGDLADHIIEKSSGEPPGRLDDG